MTVGYASTAAVLPEQYKLRIDGRDYVINYDSRTVVDLSLIHIYRLKRLCNYIFRRGGIYSSSLFS